MERLSSVDALIVEDLGRHKLSARHLVAAMQRARQRAQLVDLNDGADAIVALAQRKQPRLVVSSILFADRVNEHLALLTALREVIPHTHLSIAGHLPTLAYAELLTACPALDSALCGEAENAITQFLSVIASEAKQSPMSDLETIPGLAYRSPAPRHNLLPQIQTNLDALPFPIHADLGSFRRHGFATLEASRGCYHACTFCLPSAFYRTQGNAYRQRSIANLVDEIELLYQRGARLFLFDDDQFLPPAHQRAERVDSLGEELRRRNLQIAFTIKCRSDDVDADAELFRRLKELGLLRVYVGVESGCQSTLDLYNKCASVRQNVVALTTLDELGIVADFRALWFHPWTTLQQIETEINFLEQIAPRVSTLFDWREIEIYPGTPLARRTQMSLRGAAKRLATKQSPTDERRLLRPFGARNDKSTAWSLVYTIADARVELLRRLCHFVFNPAETYGATRDSLTEAWYDLLLARRFHPSSSDAERARALKSVVARMNGESLAVWREMLSLVCDTDIYDANTVNAKASVWAERINQETRFR